MSRKITEKLIQTHFECICGHNVVESDFFLIRWVDFTKSGIKRRRDKLTGKAFLSQHTLTTQCHCHG